MSESGGAAGFQCNPTRRGQLDPLFQGWISDCRNGLDCRTGLGRGEWRLLTERTSDAARFRIRVNSVLSLTAYAGNCRDIRVLCGLVYSIVRYNIAFRVVRVGPSALSVSGIPVRCLARRNPSM